MRIAVLALLFVAAPALAQAPAPQEGAITCSSPVAPNDIGKSLRQRYGKDAVVQELPGAEGETYKGLVLLPRAADRRIEVSFTDAMKRVTGLAIRNQAKGSRWNLSGITIGSSLAEVQKVNGKPFLVRGFDWDYGGFVADWKGGALSRMEGGCRVMMRFGKETGAPPRNLSGDGVKASSDNAALVKWGPVVTEVGIGFASGR